TFQPIAGPQGIAGSGEPSCQVLVTDLDQDRDADIVVINEESPHEVYLNDRLWAYHPGEGFGELTAAPIMAAVAADVDADGQVELYTRRPDGATLRWVPDQAGAWDVDTVVHRPEAVKHDRQLAVADFNGDGVSQIWAMDYPGWAPVVIDPAQGLSIVGISAEGPPIVHLPGRGRHAFAGFFLSGMEDVGQSMRSNASGVGAHVTVRIDSSWRVADTFRSTSGPGQSHQPVAIGLAGHDRIDFVAIDWSDGVLQSEIDLGGGLHRVPETQRQVSSCPVLFAWNGRKFEFVTDLLGVGGIGYLVAPGEYAPPRPWENVELPPGMLEPRDGRFALKLGEPMEEACYLDSVQLVAYDLPPGWSMTLDERMGILGPQPTGEPRFYRREILPARAVTERGEDVTELVAAADLQAAPVGELDRRFIGRLSAPNAVTLDFAEAIDGPHGAPTLVADGWIEYPYSQTMFGAWQAHAEFRAPTVEARGVDGKWRVILEQFGYPAGMPRRMSVPLGHLPQGTKQLRITTNQEIYWDRVAVVWTEPAPPAGFASRVFDLESAVVRRCGFAKRTTGAQRQPYYDYDDRSPYWDTRHQDGHYTAFGDARELVVETDGALAIFGPGEEVHLEFRAADEPLPAGWTRRFVLETRGWCKDMDLLTADAETLGPLPGTRDERGDRLHRLYNSRYEDH
ncbi:MAG: FG-GAP-like repeat-containing protein, partial [Planctomycetota bacterium]